MVIISFRGEIMFKWRDFYLMKVCNTRGKTLGIISDIYINIANITIDGFAISPTGLFKRKNFISIKSVISIEDGIMVANEAEKFNGTKFKSIKYIDVINDEDITIGVLDDLIIAKKALEIKGLILSSGIFDSMIKGKEIINVKHCKICDGYIKYSGNDSVKVKTLPHSLGVIKDVKKI